MLNMKFHQPYPPGGSGEEEYWLSTFMYRKGQGSRRVKIGPVTKLNEIWLYCMCMSSVNENDSF